ncbi:MAG: hypothetical protein IKZ49_03845 [Alphaproteobacteria bacterium]|nr:hypothetical protein [Alphaproteobacteria bacterium]
MTNLSKYILCVMLGILLFVETADAVCPVCTIAIGAGLESMRILGVKDVLTGIWAGGFTISLIGWTANYMKKHNIKNIFWYILNVLVYVGLLASVYFFPVDKPFVKWWENCMWGIDQFLLGSLVGAATFILMSLWYLNIKKNNGGHALFPFQKVAMPFGGLLIMTGIFWAIIKWLPSMGIVLC